MKKFSEVLGWAGILLLLCAYFLLSFEYLIGNSPIYQTMNLFGAIFVSIDLFRKKAFYMVVLQLVWGVVALISILKIFLCK